MLGDQFRFYHYPKAKTYDILKIKIADFETHISSKFDRLLKECIRIRNGTGLDTASALDMSLINFAQTYLVQINNNGPVADVITPLFTQFTKDEWKARCFEGYKYTIQFLWWTLLGEESFSATSLTNIHTSDSWKEYEYEKTIKEEENEFAFLNRSFELEKQTCFDSYFYRISEEITSSLEKKYGLPLYSIDKYFKFDSVAYNKIDLFGELLNVGKLEEPFAKLSWGEKIDNTLYWYPIEVIHSHKVQMHLGVPSFNIMLAGSVALHNKESEFSRIIVARFPHPQSKEASRNDYSYGILIDTQSAAGHYASGWVLYQDVCGDYSGFSGSEHQRTERLIKEYDMLGKIELRELIIPLNKFKEFTDEHTLSHEQLSILEQNKLIPDILQKAKAHLFELFTYYVYTQYYDCTKDSSNKFSIKLNADKQSGEKDVVVESDNQVVLIECKLNPQSYDINRIIDSMESKLAVYNKEKKYFELWFWYEPSAQNQKILRERNVKPVVVSQDRTHIVLKGANLSQLKFIMQETDIPYANTKHINFI